MNYLSFVMIYLCISTITQCTSNWGSSGSNNSNDKQHINFYGTLTTHQGQEETINEILIGGKNNDIIMYDAPINHQEESINNKTHKPEIKLETDPTENFIKSKIDLKTISSLEVTNPTTIWYYQKGRKNQRKEFLLITITEKDNDIPKQYLLEYKTHIQCNGIDHNNTQKKEVPLAAIKKLIIEGYGLTITNDKKNVQKEESKTCPIVNSKIETKEFIVQ